MVVFLFSVFWLQKERLHYDVNKNLFILPGGTVTPNPTELLARDGLDKAIDMLRTILIM